MTHEIFPYYVRDVLVVLDAVAEFRTICMKQPKHEVDPNTRFEDKPQLMRTEEGHYELDPAHYISARLLSCDAMLKKIRGNQELITDPRCI